MIEKRPISLDKSVFSVSVAMHRHAAQASSSIAGISLSGRRASRKRSISVSRTSRRRTTLGAQGDRSRIRRSSVAAPLAEKAAEVSELVE